MKKKKQINGSHKSYIYAFVIIKFERHLAMTFLKKMESLIRTSLHFRLNEQKRIHYHHFTGTTSDEEQCDPCNSSFKRNASLLLLILLRLETFFEDYDIKIYFVVRGIRN